MKRFMIGLAGLALAALAMCHPVAAQQSVQVVGPQTLATNQLSVSTTATLILPSRPFRQRTNVTIGAANQCYFGGPNVTTTNGWAPAPIAGTSFVYENASPLYAVCASTTTISYMEGY